MAVEGIGSNLYFQAAQAQASQQAAKSKKQEETKKTSEKKGLFATLFEKSQAEVAVTQDGFPIEIASMEIEEAAVYLRDMADSSADVLKEHQTPETFADYRKKVSQFLKYVTKNNFELSKKRRIKKKPNGMPYEPLTQINVINEKLDEMARWLINPKNDIHRKTLYMLSRIDEIKGLLVDLIAS